MVEAEKKIRLIHDIAGNNNENFCEEMQQLYQVWSENYDEVRLRHKNAVPTSREGLTSFPGQRGKLYATVLD